MIDEPREPHEDEQPEASSEPEAEEEGVIGKPVVPRRAVAGRRGRTPRRAAERFSRGRVSIGEILAGTFSVYFRGFLVFSGIALLFLLPHFLLLEKWVGVVLADVSPYEDNYYFATFTFVVILALGMFVLTQASVGAVVYGVFLRQRNQRAGIVRCIATALGRLPQLVAMALFFAACTSLPLLPGLLLLLVAPALAFFVFLVGFVFFCMIYTALIVAPAAVVVERVGPMASLGRSLRLTRGNRWRIFCVLLVLGIFNRIVELLVNAGVTASAGAFDPETYVWFAQIMTWAVNVFNTGLLAVAVGLAYYHLKVKVEGVDEDELAAVFD